MRFLKILSVVLVSTALGAGGAYVVLDLLDLPSADTTIETIPLSFGSVADATTSTTIDTQISVSVPSQSGVDPPPPTPEQLDARAALEDIPSELLDTLGGRDALKVVAFDTLDGPVEGWTGDDITIESGRVVLGEGFYSPAEGLGAPVAVIGRISQSADAGYEIQLESGTWDTSSFRRWGFYGGTQFAPNAWDGRSQVDLEFVPVDATADETYWIVLGLNDDSAMLGVWDGGPADPQGTSMQIDGGTTRWDLNIQIFAGSVTIDEYYVLSP